MGPVAPRHVDLPRPGLEPVSSALAGRFSTTAPPGKPRTFILNSNISTCLRPTVSFPALMIWAVVDLGPLALFLFRDFWHFTVALARVGGEKPYELKFKPVTSAFCKCIVHLWITCTPALHPWLTHKIWALAGYHIYLGIFLQLAYIYSFRHVFRQYPRNFFFSIIFAVIF